jgi:hypothetical protein
MPITPTNTTQAPVTKENVGTVMRKYVKAFREAEKKQDHYEVEHIGRNGRFESYYDKNNKVLFTKQYCENIVGDDIYKMTNEKGEHITFVDLDGDGNLDSVGVYDSKERGFVARDLNDDGKYIKNKILDIKW